MVVMWFISKKKIVRALAITGAAIFILSVMVSLFKSDTTNLLNEYSTPKPELECKVYLNNITMNSTLLLKPTTEILLYLPTSDTEITFKKSDVVKLSCPGSNVTINGSIKGIQEEVSCDGDDMFLFDKENVSFENITCSEPPKNIARYTNDSCLKDYPAGYKEIEIGFQVTDNQFLRTILICFDNVTRTTMYSKHNLSRFINRRQKFNRTMEIEFEQGEFFNMKAKLKNLYTPTRQRKNVNNLLGLNETDETYIKSSSSYFLSRGHLTPNGDFIFEAQRLSTYHYVNVLPQWQTLNSGNWNILEDSLRKFVVGRKNDLIVYTGGEQVAVLPHANKTEGDIPIYLFKSKNITIPIPRFLWKMVIDPVKKAGIIFIGVNNPHINNTEIEKEMFCGNATDVELQKTCDNVTWVTFKPNSAKKGYIYCCDIQQMKQKFKNIPEVEVTQLLIN